MFMQVILDGGTNFFFLVNEPEKKTANENDHWFQSNDGSIPAEKE